MRFCGPEGVKKSGAENEENFAAISGGLNEVLV
jgi:hypothetical protein